MSTALVPGNFDFRANKPAAAFVGQGPIESLSDGIGSSYAVLGYRGKILTLRVRGDEHLFLRPDDGTPASYVDVVILRQAKVKSKSLYPGGTFDEQKAKGTRPICSSLDGVTPDPDAQDIQSDTCALCPKNEWKTGADGKRRRDCQDYKRLAVFVLPHQTQHMLGGQPHLEPVFLRVPPDSLNDLAIFGDNMTNQGWPYYSFITRISFDPLKAHPKFVFTPLKGLSDAEASMINEMREDILSQRITAEADIAQRLAAPRPAPRITQAAPVAPATQATPATHQPATQAILTQAPVQSTTATRGPVAPTPASPPTIDLTPQQGGAFGLTPPPGVTPPPAVTGAFGLGAQQVAPAPVATPQTTALSSLIGQTSDDTGEPDGDADLDAAINAMLQTKTQ